MRALLVIAALPNLVLAAAAAPHGTRALVNVEYLVLAPLAGVISRGMLAVLLAVCLLLDLVFSFAPVFNFGPGEVVAAVEQVRHFTGRALWSAIALVGIVVAVAALLARLAIPRPGAFPQRPASRRLVLGYVAACILALVADVANGTNAIGWRPRTVVPVDVTTSLIAGQYARDMSQPPESGQPMPAATDDLRRYLAGATDAASLPPRIVLVIVEAMGVPRGADLAAAFRPLTTPALRQRYQVRTGRVPYEGATTSGEFRELCGIRMSHVTARHADIPPCIPVQLARLGYETMAMHAYSGSLFERRDWYPRVGFARSVFAEELGGKGPMPGCGLMFHGPCDSAVLPLLREELSGLPATRRFIYWLTLSSHFPLDPRAQTNAGACRAIGPAGTSSEGCSLWSSVWPVLEGVARLASDTTLPPAWWVIVGDHGPPRVFATGPGFTEAQGDSSPFARDRRAFSPDEVPFIELRPVSGARH